MASIDFYASQGGGTHVDMNGSGLSFFGAAFGNSVQVGQYQDSTYITQGGGTPEGPQATNCKYDTSDGSGILVDDDAVAVQPSAIALNSGTMNIRFTHASAVNTQNGQVRIYDRTTITNGATGVTTQILQIVNGGSGVSTSGTAEALASHSGWIAASGENPRVNLLNNPGSGGLGPSGASDLDTRHDWFMCLSATPLSIGPKILYGIYAQLEYLT